MNDFKYVIVNMICFLIFSFGSLISMEHVTPVDACNAVVDLNYGYKQVAARLSPSNHQEGLHKIHTALAFIGKYDSKAADAVIVDIWKQAETELYGHCKKKLFVENR